jgi:catechol 2,3-dioxygenase-like lactoylglutathione lyase family enzyme
VTEKLDYMLVKRDEDLPTPKIRTEGIDHVALHVADAERSRRFYIELLGFTPYFEVDRHIFLRSGSCQIGLFESLDGVDAYAELDHVCIRSTDTTEEILAALAAYGVERIGRPEGRGWKVQKMDGIYFRDPDGHVLQLLPKGTWPQVDQKGIVTIRGRDKTRPPGWGHG